MNTSKYNNRFWLVGGGESRRKGQDRWLGPDTLTWSGDLGLGSRRLSRLVPWLLFAPVSQTLCQKPRFGTERSKGSVQRPNLAHVSKQLPATKVYLSTSGTWSLGNSVEYIFCPCRKGSLTHRQHRLPHTSPQLPIQRKAPMRFLPRPEKETIDLGQHTQKGQAHYPMHHREWCNKKIHWTVRFDKVSNLRKGWVGVRGGVNTGCGRQSTLGDMKRAVAVGAVIGRV